MVDANTNPAHKPLSALAYLGFEQMMPSAPLRPYVQCYWFIHRAQPLPGYQQEFLHPDGGAGMMFNWGDTLQLEGRPLQQVCLLDGVNTRARRLGLQGQVEAMGVRFKPGGAYPFLALPLAELMDHHMLLADVVSPAMQSVGQQVYQASSREARVAQLEQWLIGRLQTAPLMAPVVSASLAMIKNHGGQISIKKVADSLYVSQRQIERLYKIQVGMSPKRYARIVRVRAARQVMRQWGKPVTPVGFYDQSHFIREFKSIVGMTPQTYLTRRKSGG